MSFASLAPAVQAQTLLQEWEQHTGRTHASAYAAARPARLARFAALCAALRSEAEVSLDDEDICTVLRWATDFRIGTAAAVSFPTDGTPPQEIRLRFAPVQGRYALSYPLHSSQEVLVNNEAEICLRLTVYDTHDLRMELLSYGPEVEVLAPAALRAWQRRQHGAATGG